MGNLYHGYVKSPEGKTNDHWISLGHALGKLCLTHDLEMPSTHGDVMSHLPWAAGRKLGVLIFSVARHLGRSQDGVCPRSSLW
jgi:hypothetical protein